jgi:signal peptidase I
MRKGAIIFVVVVSGTIALVAVIAIVSSFILEPLIITGHSMSPTIMQGDRILVSKLTYRFREPSRGDVIAFRIGWKRVVKRIVGLPGDVIEVRDGLLYRNGEVIAHEPYTVLYSYDSHRRPYWSRKVRDKHVFVMGDNKVMSVDSRDFGPIPYQDIIGKVVFIYFPPKRIGKLGVN